MIAKKLCNFIFLCRSPSQPTDILDQFTDNQELTIDEVKVRKSIDWFLYEAKTGTEWMNRNPLLIVILGDFHV